MRESFEASVAAAQEAWGKDPILFTFAAHEKKSAVFIQEFQVVESLENLLKKESK